MTARAVRVAGALAGGALAGAVASRPLRPMLHLFQLDGYRYDRLRGHLRREHARTSTIAAGLLGGPGVAAKKPLVWTPRARRTFGVAVGTAGAATAGAGLVSLALAPVSVVAAVAATPELLGAADALLTPQRRAETARYVRRARARLAEVDPLVIGVSGAFGKTSTKNFLAPMLEARLRTLPTPASYNTLLGLVRTINERLEPAHGAFVAEMGAYREGDIAELCDLVAPSHGILCRLGPVHLERFGSIEAIVRAERELLVSLPADGVGVVHGGDVARFAIAGPDLRCRLRAVHHAADLAAPGAAAPAAGDVVVDAIAPSARGTRFTVDFGDGTAPEAFDTPLLGAHTVENVAAALALADALGVPRGWLVRATATLQPAEHRLQLRRQAGGVTVLDDTYNANPDGAAAALAVLADRPATRRIVVTPGMIELGEREADENRRFGRRAGEVADAVLVVGAAARVAPLVEGAREGAASRAGGGPGPGPGDPVRRFNSLAEATAALAGLLVPETVVLFENDLPDNYDVAAPGRRR